MAEENKTLNVNEFKNKWKDALIVEDTAGGGTGKLSVREYMLRHTKIPRRLLSELETVCGTHTLDCKEEPKDRDAVLFNTAKGTGLVSVAFQSKDLERRNKDVTYRCFLNERRRYLPRKTPWEHQRLSKLKTPQSTRIDTSDVIITVEVFRPYQKSKRIILDQEFQVLGCQYLTELRDKIKCLSDFVIPGEYSDRPNVCPTHRTKDLYKSGFFFIENVFYNDLRDPNSQDNSSVIIDWAKKSKLANYTSQRMEHTKFSDLTLTLGQPYVYEHQGSCQHVMIFSDVRLIHKDDCQNQSQYPIVTLERPYKRIMCRICSMYGAKWITRQCKMAPEDPCFYCNSCFQAFHYDKSGKKLFDFKAYHLTTEPN